MQLKIFFIWYISFECLLLKVLAFCMWLHNWYAFFQQYGSNIRLHHQYVEEQLSENVILKFLLFLKLRIRTKENTFSWSSSQARITCNYFYWLFWYLNTGYVILNVRLLYFPGFFCYSFRTSSFPGISLSWITFFKKLGFTPWKAQHYEATTRHRVTSQISTKH